MSRSSYFVAAPVALIWAVMIVAVIFAPQDSRPGLEATLIIGSVLVGATTGSVLVWSLSRVRSRATKALSLIGYMISVPLAFGMAGQYLEAFDFRKGSLVVATFNFAVVAIIPLTLGTVAGLVTGVVSNTLIDVALRLRQYKLIGVILVLGWFLSLLTWIYGNSIEQGDMSNAGLQIMGFLGTAGFGVIAVTYFTVLLFSRR